MIRAADLSLDQKIALLAGADTWHTPGFADPPVPALRMSDGPAGVRGPSWSGPPSASFPCGSALGATWDPALVYEVGRALGREARQKRAHVLLAPTVNLHRVPLSGRNFEFPSEDPVLAAEYAVAYVAGVQDEGVACCIKHFVGNETEHERMTVSSDIDERTLRELYFAPFEAAVKRARVRSVMSAYNRLNGTYCADHRWLLTDVLRGEWGFDGVVVSDWFGCHTTVDALRAGLDIEMPGPPIQRGDRLREAVKNGAIDESELDPAVDRVLALADWTGAADVPPDGSAEQETGADPETRAVIRRAATRAMVLLKNDGAVLPLRTPRSLALIGPSARFGRRQGGGSALVRPQHGRGPLDALVARGIDVSFEPGGSIAKYLPPLRGDFRIEYAGPDGATATVAARRTTWYWDRPPAEGIDARRFSARVVGPFTPDVSGPWELGVRAVGAVTVRLDGDAVIELDDSQSGGAFFGLGSHEVRAPVDLEAGRFYTVEVDYPAPAEAIVRGLAVGAAPVPAGDEIERAATAARNADAAVVIVGTDEDWETEGEDRAGLGLPGEQDALVQAVAAANPNTVVVLNTGSPVTMPWLDAVPAVLQLWFPGQELGDALADVLLGDAEPGGRLPLTFPRRIEDTPAFPYYPGVDGRQQYGERLHIGHRWYDRQGIEPLFPFGFGLGYTEFALEPVSVEGRAEDGVQVTVAVTNTGARAGGEVVQVYVEPPPGDHARPLRALAAFTRADLDAGATEHVTIDVPPRAFQSWLDARWMIPPGEYKIHVGNHSRNLKLAGAVHA